MSRNHEAGALVVELLTIGSQSPSAVRKRINELSRAQLADVAEVAVGMTYSSSVMIAEMKGIPVIKFLRAMGLNMAQGRDDAGYNEIGGGHG